MLLKLTCHRLCVNADWWQGGKVSIVFVASMLIDGHNVFCNKVFECCCFLWIWIISLDLRYYQILSKFYQILLHCRSFVLENPNWHCCMIWVFKHNLKNPQCWICKLHDLLNPVFLPHLEYTTCLQLNSKLNNAWTHFFNYDPLIPGGYNTGT